MRAIIGLSSLVLIISSPLVSLGWADSITTPFELDLKDPSVAILLAQVPAAAAPSGTLHVSLPDQTLTAPYAVSITGISLDLTYAFRTTEQGAWNSWSLQSQTLSAGLTVKEVNASQVLTVESNGTTLTLTVNAVCTDVHLSLPPGATQATGELDFAFQDGKPSLTLTSFAAAWVPGSWVVDSMNCQGPNGFGDLVAQNALSALQTINPFLNTIETQIQPALDTFSSTSMQLAFDLSSTAHTPGLSLSFSPTSITATPAGLAAIQGTATLNFASLSGVCGSTITGPFGSEDPGAITEDSLLVPFELLQEVARCTYGLGALEASFNNQQLPGFQTLLGDPFIDFFIWPDLIRFGSNSIFDFNLAATGAPTLESPTEGKDGALAFKLNAALGIAMAAPDAQPGQGYVNFSTDLTSPASIAIAGNQITLKASKPKLTLAAKWDPHYTATHDVFFTYIATSVLGDAIKTYIGETGFTFTLPTWKAPDGAQISIQGQSLESTNLRLGLGITAPNN